jgi:hypothetical protein
MKMNKCDGAVCRASFPLVSLVVGASCAVLLADVERTETAAYHNSAEGHPGSSNLAHSPGSFGNSIAVDQGLLLVGDRSGGVGSAGEHAGRAVLFDVFSGEEGTIFGGERLGILDENDCGSVGGPGTCTFFGYSVSIENGFAAIGEPWREGGTSRDTGRVSVFNLDDLSEAEFVLEPSSDRIESGFGYSVLLRDDVLLVGINGSATEDARGAVEVFETETFASIGMLPIPDGIGSEDLFGHAIAADKDSNLVAIGACRDPYASGSNSSIGSAYLYQVTSGTMQTPQVLLERATLAPPADFDDSDRYGAAVAVDGAYAAVGAPGRSVAGDDELGSGHVSLFRRQDDGTWAFERAIMPPYNGDYTAYGFGASIEFADGRIFVGAPGTKFEQGSNGTGAVFSFNVEFPEACSHIYCASGPVDPPGNREEGLGVKIEIDGDRLFASAPWNAGTSARVLRFDISPSADINGDGNVDVTDLLAVIAEWGCTGCCSADVNGDGVVNVTDLLAVIEDWHGVRVNATPVHGAGKTTGG